MPTVRNDGWAYTVRLDGAPGDLAAWLAARFPHSDLATWRARVAAGEVVVDGPLRAGAVVTWRRPGWEEPAVPEGWRILWVDQDVLAVDKPPGVPTMPAGGLLRATLLTQVRAVFPEAAPMHRLGRGTSGVVLFGRTPRARAALQAAWRDRRVVKVYRALVEGVPEEQRVELPIGPVAHPRLGTVHAVTPDGRPARSDVRVVAAGDGRAVVEVVIDTGRPHQIRAHLAAVGHPLVGDPLYAAGGAPRGDALPGDAGYLLHAWRLEVDHPDPARGRVVVESPLPASLR